MPKKKYHCQECGSPVYLSMAYCDQCGKPLYIDPKRLVCNLAVASQATEKLPVEQREYELIYDSAFNTMEELLNERHKYDVLPRKERDVLIYGDHLVYVYYQLGSLKNGRLKIQSALSYVPVGTVRVWFSKHRIYYLATIDFPESIKIID